MLRAAPARWFLSSLWCEYLCATTLEVPDSNQWESLSWLTPNKALPSQQSQAIQKSTAVSFGGWIAAEGTEDRNGNGSGQSKQSYWICSGGLVFTVKECNFDDGAEELFVIRLAAQTKKWPEKWGKNPSGGISQPARAAHRPNSSQLGSSVNTPSAF